MKAMKIVGLLFVFFCMNNVQSMQLPEKPVDPMAKNFLDGKISVDDYLSYVDAYKVRDIRNAEPGLYNTLLADVRTYILQAKRLSRVGKTASRNRVINNVHRVIQEKIDTCYSNLEQGTIRYGRES